MYRRLIYCRLIMDILALSGQNSNQLLRLAAMLIPDKDSKQTPQHACIYSVWIEKRLLVTAAFIDTFRRMFVTAVVSAAFIRSPEMTLCWTFYLFLRFWRRHIIPLSGL